MNSDLIQFVSKYLCVVLATFMVVTFVAFVFTPYSLKSSAAVDTAAPQATAQPTT